MLSGLLTLLPWKTKQSSPSPSMWMELSGCWWPRLTPHLVKFQGLQSVQVQLPSSAWSVPPIQMPPGVFSYNRLMYCIFKTPLHACASSHEYHWRWLRPSDLQDSDTSAPPPPRTASLGSRCITCHQIPPSQEHSLVYICLSCSQLLELQEHYLETKGTVKWYLLFNVYLNILL